MVILVLKKDNHELIACLKPIYWKRKRKSKVDIMYFKLLLKSVIFRMVVDEIVLQSGKCGRESYRPKINQKFSGKYCTGFLIIKN